LKISLNQILAFLREDSFINAHEESFDVELQDIAISCVALGTGTKKAFDSLDAE